MYFPSPDIIEVQVDTMEIESSGDQANEAAEDEKDHK